MEPLEKFIVESTIPDEAESYKGVIADVISDLRLAASIGRLHSIVLPEESRFTLVAVLRDIEPTVRVEDVCALSEGYENEKNVIRFSIQREKYMPELTNYLWDTYGRMNVFEHDRWTIFVSVEDPKQEILKIKDVVIANPALSLHANMIEMAIRSVPEGFRVRHHRMENRDFIFVASEDPLDPAWIDEAYRMLNDLKGDVV